MAKEKKGNSQLSTHIPVDLLPKDYLINPWDEGGSIYHLQSRIIDSLCLEDYAYFYEDELSSINVMPRFLENCRQVGIDVVSVLTSTQLIHESTSFPFRPHSSVFSRPMKYNGRPAIWEATKFTRGLETSAGNRNQRQIVNTDSLIAGVYVYKDGQWWNWIGE